MPLPLLFYSGSPTATPASRNVAVIRSLPLEALDGTDLLPLGHADVSVEQLAAQGIPFANDVDDLDQFQIAAFALMSDSSMFALRAYRGAPAGRVDLLLPASRWPLEASEATRNTLRPIERALSVFGIGRSQIHWSVTECVPRATSPPPA